MVWLIAISTVVVIAFLLLRPKKRSHDQYNYARQVADLEHKIYSLEKHLDHAEDSELPALDLDHADTQEDQPEFFDRAKGRALAVDLIIDFKDRAGKKTHREITTRSYQYSATDGLLDAYCHLRKAHRPFLFSRIERVVDPKSGRAIEDLRAWLDSEYSRTPGAEIDRLLNEHWAALRCLHHVAKADGAFRSKEKEVVRLFLSRHAPQAESETIDQIISEMSHWYPMSAIAFGKEIRKLMGKPEAYRRDVVATAEALVQTDKTIYTAETNALKRLKERR
jgi:predicted DNA-binding transcriptional regulator YafY